MPVCDGMRVSVCLPFSHIRELKKLIQRIKKWSIVRSQIPHHKSLLLFMALRDLSRGAPTMSVIIGKLSAWQISDVKGEESG